MGAIKDRNRNSKDLTETEEFEKRWQEYTELYRKCLMAQMTMKAWSLT